MEQGLLIIERDEPFNEKFLDFLKPLINTAAHIISIKKLESNHSELDRFLSLSIRYQHQWQCLIETCVTNLQVMLGAVAL